jgi:hypothetical protein
MLTEADSVTSKSPLGNSFRNAARYHSSSGEKKIISDSDDDDTPTRSTSSVVSHDPTTSSQTGSPTLNPVKSKDRKSGDRMQRRYVVAKIELVVHIA